MHTIMKITATECPGKPEFLVRFGCDILDDLTKEERDAHARRNYKVDIQNGKLRLRSIDDMANIQEVLRTRWPNATVEKYVAAPKKERVLTNDEVIDALAKNMLGLSRAQLREFIEKHTKKDEPSPVENIDEDEILVDTIEE